MVFADTLFGTDIRLFGASSISPSCGGSGLTVLATFVLLRTQFGNWIFGAGGDANCRSQHGCSRTRVKIMLFMTTAFAAFLVALIQAVQFNGSDSLRGTLQEFNAIIAVVVGGTLLTGGYGSVVGAMFGALIFAMVQQGIIITGVDGGLVQSLRRWRARARRHLQQLHSDTGGAAMTTTRHQDPTARGQEPLEVLRERDRARRRLDVRAGRRGHLPAR